MEQPQDRILVMAPYRESGPATAGFGHLADLSRGRKVHSEGVILVSHDESGEVCVHHTADHLGRTGLGWAGGVGLLVGLFAPHLLASVAAEDRLDTERALAGAAATSLAVIEGPLLRGRRGALAEAAGKFHPDRTMAESIADFIGGFALWMDEQGHLIHTCQYLGIDTYRQTSTEPVPSGDVQVRMLFEADEPQPGTGGNVTLWANGRKIGVGGIPRTVSLLYTTDAGMDMGRDNGVVVDPAYEEKAPYAFTGTVKRVVLDLQPHSHDDEQRLHGHAAMAGVGHGAAG